VRTDDVLGEIVAAPRAVETCGLPEADRLATVELIARSRLSVATGERASVARLDPGTHRKDRGEADDVVRMEA
jgi:hypothetical protein